MPFFGIGKGTPRQRAPRFMGEAPTSPAGEAARQRILQGSRPPNMDMDMPMMEGGEGGMDQIDTILNAIKRVGGGR